MHWSPLTAVVVLALACVVLAGVLGKVKSRWADRASTALLFVAFVLFGAFTILGFLLPGEAL